MKLYYENPTPVRVHPKRGNWAGGPRVPDLRDLLTHGAPENSPLQSHRLQAKERAVSGRADLLKPAKACYNLLSLLQCRVSDERLGTADETLLCGRGEKGGAIARLKGH